jgi:hypothetical protein
VGAITADVTGAGGLCVRGDRQVRHCRRREEDEQDGEDLITAEVYEEALGR